ncbi:hypothetical protein [Streptomyces sp. NPDC047985]|uniref:hypothetical protein n=1 Tax=Streptomyces sp. NPDC047985 TaxID=3155384 RepID=UPI0034454765
MGLLLVVAVTSASVQDRAGGRAVLARLAVGFRTVGLVWADGGYANSVDSTPAAFMDSSATSSPQANRAARAGRRARRTLAQMRG